MTKVTLVNSPDLSTPVGFAHVSVAAGFVWVSGQISCDSSGTVLFPGDIAAQFRHAIRNVGAALESAGCKPTDVVKLTYFVTDVSAYRDARGSIGVAYREVFGRHYPASTLVEVKGLFEPEALVEIECIAVRGDSTLPQQPL